MRQRREL